MKSLVGRVNGCSTKRQMLSWDALKTLAKFLYGCYRDVSGCIGRVLVTATEK
jgi:hypothetical protein